MLQKTHQQKVIERGKILRRKGRPFVAPLIVVRVEETGNWIFTWVPTTAPYEIWLDGVLLSTQTDTTYTFALPGYEDVPPDLEIIDATVDDAENYLYPPFLHFQWRGVQGAMGYVVQRYEGAEWVDQGDITETGAGYYSWKTLALEDGSTWSYRILALTLNGNTGGALEFTTTIVRNPTHPEVSLFIETTGDLVIS